MIPTTDGLVKINIPSASTQDLASNDNVAAPEISRTYDITPPTLTLTSPTLNPTTANPIPMTAQFSEPVLGFDISDIVITNGTAT